MNTRLLLSLLPDYTDVSKLVLCHLCVTDCTPPSICDPKEPFPCKLPLIKQLVSARRNLKTESIGSLSKMVPNHYAFKLHFVL